MGRRQTFHFRPEGEKAFGFAQAVQAGGALYVSGTLAVDDQWKTVCPGDMAGQIRAVYATLRETLNRFGASFADVVREAIYVTDMDSFIAANEARKETYANLDLPAATAVEVKRLAFPQNLIEIEITAVISE